MRSLAKNIAADPVVHEEFATVTRIDGARIALRTDLGTLYARRAVSCLVEPAVGDLVLYVVRERNAYVLAVLERDSGEPTTMSVDGDFRVKVSSGRFTVAAQNGVDLVSGENMSIVTGALDVTANDANFVVQKLSLLGAAVMAEVEKVKVFADTVDSVIERVSQRVKRAYRFVEEFDQVRAEQIDYTAKKTLRMHGQNTVLTANELVKLDGEQIHLG